MRDLLGSPLGPDVTEVSKLSAAPPQPETAEKAAKSAGGWLGLANLFKAAPSESDESELRRQVKEYEQRLADMRELAERQSKDIAALRSMAERQMSEAGEEGRARDEERWSRMLQSATSTHEQALAQGQRTLSELAQSLHEAQRSAAEAQAAEMRRTLLETSETHAKVVEQLQAQLKASTAEKIELQTL